MSEHTSPDSQSKSNRVVRDLTASEQQKLNFARAESLAAKSEIIAEGKLRKLALRTVDLELESLIGALKARREKLGLSLADVEALSGIKRSALSRLENGAKEANPTLLTLERYALALGMSVHVSLGNA